MYKVEIYISDQRVDTFKDEDISITLSTQNVKDISKVFGDFTQSFTLPATPNNNGIFKHYYNVDIATPFDAQTRVDSLIEINNNLFRVGTIELESVQMKGNEPYAYKVSFYSNNTNLKDLFGEDTLNDLDLSSQDHEYTNTNVETGLSAFVPSTSDSVVYPLISPKRNWKYDSSSNMDAENLAANGSTSTKHGCFWYELKPAIKVKRIIEAIETKYSVNFDSDFFGGTNFGMLYMWAHRRANFLFKDNDLGDTPTLLTLNTTSTDDRSANIQTANDVWTLGSSSYELTSDLYVTSAFTATDRYRLILEYSYTGSIKSKIHLFKDGEIIDTHKEGTSASGTFFFDEKGVYDIRISDRRDAAASITVSSLTIQIRLQKRAFNGVITTVDTIIAASNSGTQSVTKFIRMADQLPEQKVSEFFSGIVKMFNLVIVPTGQTTTKTSTDSGDVFTTIKNFDIESLDDWYGEGANIDITKYIDVENTEIKKPELYKRIEYKFNDANSILEEQFRLDNDRNYGDVKADFTYDGGEFKVEVPFDHQIYDRLTDQNTDTQTALSVGRSINRELEAYIGKPLLFNIPAAITGLASGSQYYFIDMSNGVQTKDAFWLVSNTNATTTDDVTQTINFGVETDSYHLTAFQSGLFRGFWEDYITDLYNTQRRIFKFKARLPISILLRLKNNDKIIILQRTYIINSVQMNLTTGEANLELLNDV
jgi:hypothetical protein